MATWDIISVDQASKFIRIPQSEIQDFWYDVSIGLIEQHTGWTLDIVDNIDEKIDGTDSTHIEVTQFPISSVSQVKVMGDIIPSSYYAVKWNMIQLLSYRGEDVSIYNGLYSIDVFPYGVGNVQVIYDCGGVNSLPNKYKQAVTMCLLMLCKEISTNFRGEGSDQILRKFRPDRTQNPEEVLINYGQHGKMEGILKALLPKRKHFA